MPAKFNLSVLGLDGPEEAGVGMRSQRQHMELRFFMFVAIFLGQSQNPSPASQITFFHAKKGTQNNNICYYLLSNYELGTVLSVLDGYFTQSSLQPIKYYYPHKNKQIKYNNQKTIIRHPNHRFCSILSLLESLFLIWSLPKRQYFPS